MQSPPGDIVLFAFEQRTSSKIIVLLVTLLLGGALAAGKLGVIPLNGNPSDPLIRYLVPAIIGLSALIATTTTWSLFFPKPVLEVTTGGLRFYVSLGRGHVFCPWSAVKAVVPTTFRMGRGTPSRALGFHLDETGEFKLPTVLQGAFRGGKDDCSILFVQSGLADSVPACIRRIEDARRSQAGASR